MFFGPIAVLSLLLGLPPAWTAPLRADAAPTGATDATAQSYRFAGTRWGASVDETRAVLAAHGFALAPESPGGAHFIFSGLLNDRPAVVVAIFGDRGLTKVLVSLPTKDDTTMSTYREIRDALGLQYGTPELDVERYDYPFGDCKHVGYEAAALRVGKATIGAMWQTNGEALGIKITDHLIVSAHYESPAWRLDVDKRRD
jgi:hypothetical protein